MSRPDIKYLTCPNGCEDEILATITDVGASDGLYWKDGELTVNSMMFGWSGDVDCQCQGCGVEFEAYEVRPGYSQA